jgi:hypothetical protein
LVAKAQTLSGADLEVVIPQMLGSPAHPLTEAQQMEKARRCLAHADLEWAHLSLAEAVASLDLATDAAQALDVWRPHCG